MVIDHDHDGVALLEAQELSKSFGATRVLTAVDIAVRPGEVRGLVGQNGSGKSTLIKILTGFHEPDPGGALRLRGEDVPLPVSGTRAAALGLGVMHQDPGLEPSLSVLDNFLLDASAPSLRRIRWRRRAVEVSRVLAGYGLDVDVRRPIEELTSSQRAVVAMARAFHRLGQDDAGILVLDEPTASLEHGDADTLFTGIRAARDRGCGVLFVSHDLDEVRSVCDTVTVLRDGVLVAEGVIGEFSELELIRAIVGKDIGDLYPPVPAPRSGPVALRAHRLNGAVLREFSLEIREGEVVGVTGLAGMGQDELPEVLFGARPLTGGEVELYGERHEPEPRRSIAKGLILLPADRKALGGDMASTVADNLVVPVVGRYFRKGRMRHDVAVADVRAVLEEFDVRPPDPHRLLGELSGGNQQKALLAKWLSLFGSARILLLHEATQGVDVGARAEIFRLIRDSAAKGLAVLYVSTEHEDLANLCDRVVVVRDGRIAAEVDKAHLSGARISALALATERQAEAVPSSQ